MVSVAQLAEHRLVAARVAGSNPVTHPDRFQLESKKLLLTLEPPNAVTLPYGVIGNMTDSDSVVFGSSPDRAALEGKTSDINKYGVLVQRPSASSFQVENRSSNLLCPSHKQPSQKVNF